MAKSKKEDLFLSPKGHPRDRILVHENPNLPSDGLFVALNGYSFHIPLGIPVDVPRPVRQMLETRIQTEHRTVLDAPGKVSIHSRNIPRIPFVLIAENVDAEPVPVETTQLPPSPSA